MIEEVPDLSSGNAGFRRVTIESSGTPKRTGESVDGKLQGKRSGTGPKRASQHQARAGGGACRSWSGSRNGVLLSGRSLASDLDQSGRCPERPDGQPGRAAHQPLRGISRRGDQSQLLAKQFPLDQFKGDSVLVGLNAYSQLHQVQDRARQPGHAGRRHESDRTGWSTAGCRSTSCPPPLSFPRP